MHGENKSTLFKSKTPMAEKGIRPVKKAPNRPIYCEDLDCSKVGFNQEDDLALVIRQEEPRKFNELPDS